MVAKKRRIFRGWMVKRFDLLHLPSPISWKTGLLGTDCTTWKLLNGTRGCFSGCSGREGTTTENNVKIPIIDKKIKEKNMEIMLTDSFESSSMALEKSEV